LFVVTNEFYNFFSPQVLRSDFRGTAGVLFRDGAIVCLHAI